MEFWIKSELDNINLLLPVTPKLYDLSYGNKVETINTIAGDINIMTTYKLANIRVDGFFTTNDYYYRNRITYNVNTVHDYVEVIKMFIAYKRVIRFIIVDSKSTIINLQFKIEDIMHSQSDASGDIDYSLILRQYIDVTAKTNNNALNIASSPVRTVSKQTTNINKVHTVVSGDTLSKLARKYYGDVNQYMKIFDANKNKLKNPNLIYVGDTLLIP